jgi:tetratricopeptide (TPR) repeat protein
MLIGPYRIVRSLGQGGMGEVFLAERADDQFRQQVAIKLVRRGLLSRHVQGRLRQERQILASLDHPNIARLYDGGATADGTPYIVMEYVDGEPIDTFCDKRRLTLEHRLRLFITVCAAVHRAHQNLIVHRDLKPSNILVTPDGTAKLLDFGIAKLLDDRAMMHTLAVTQADVRVMTPDHASPEQIRGDLISTASDIYVLGVLLYELLSGCKPFAMRRNRLAELERAICEDPPPPLNSVAGTNASIANSSVLEIASQRSVSVAKLRRELRGDLDNIVMMAMRKEPERRYSSVEQLAADIDHYLRGMPVMARPDAWTYRATRFVQRHALVVALSAAFAALLVGFTITTYLQSSRIALERDAAEQARARAEAESERAKTVSDFLIESFSAADPSHARGREITAREILDAGATRIGRELRSQPALLATMLDTIGTAYLGLNLPAEAQPLIEQGLSVRRALGNELEVARSLYSLNRVYEEQGDLSTSEKLARESLAINQRLTPEDSVTTANSLCRLGIIQQAKGELALAEQLLNQCMNILVLRRGPDDQQISVPLDNLARIAQDRNDYATAERLIRRALDIDRHTRGEDHPQYIRHLQRLATLTYDRGDLKGAEALFRQSIALFQHVLGAEHSETVDAMSAFGTFQMETGHLEDAQGTLQKVLELNRKGRGAHHAYVGNDLENLGRLAFRKQQFAQAESLFRQALEIYRETLSPGHGFIAAASTMLGRTELEQGRAKDAELDLRKALDSWRLQYGEKSAGYAMARACLGRALAVQGRLAEAEPALLESYPIILKSPRGADAQTANMVHRWIESLYQSKGQPAAAQQYFERLGSGH